MIGIVRDRKFRNLMMWVICIISLALCLHVNTHNAEATYPEHTVYEFEGAHFHDVHQKQNHIHHDNFHEHFGGDQSGQSMTLLFTFAFILIPDRVKNYLYLMISRIFKPPKTSLENFLF
ncbi:hypothetical protein ACS72_14635 [Acinetobacter sp. VT 511]|uniref:hypothetical protein n=1 Tax=Acinetobacter sp. VT 511 TaxID=1675902 RepID=UPI000662856E|nr:hypothetical protein [Acinetobacter sp. VT 511]KMU98447.1 hypothetical protein ACS72_14635 [Acinetobacter sp. VT 511]